MSVAASRHLRKAGQPSYTVRASIRRSIEIKYLYVRTYANIVEICTGTDYVPAVPVGYTGTGTEYGVPVLVYFTVQSTRYTRALREFTCQMSGEPKSDILLTR